MTQPARENGIFHECIIMVAAWCKHQRNACKEQAQLATSRPNSLVHYFHSRSQRSLAKGSLVLVLLVHARPKASSNQCTVNTWFITVHHEHEGERERERKRNLEIEHEHERDLNKNMNMDMKMNIKRNMYMNITLK
jgi:hypothetical protein